MIESKHFSARTLRLLITLRNGGEIKGGDIQSREAHGLFEYLIRSGAVSVGRQKSRRRYTAPDTLKFLQALKEYDAILEDLDGALRIAEGEKITREEKTKLWGNSKMGGADASESGFSIISCRPVEVSNHGTAYTITPDTALLVCDDGESLLLPDSWTIITVENSRLFFRHDWLRNIGLPEDSINNCFIIKRNPITEDQFRFLQKVPNQILYYFGDLDLAGVRIYETEYKRRLGDKVHSIVPPDAETRISGPKGNRELYKDQMDHGFSNVESISGELTQLLEIIHRHQRCYEQEGYCFTNQE